MSGSSPVRRTFAAMLICASLPAGVCADPVEHFVASLVAQRQPGGSGGSLGADWIGRYGSHVLTVGAMASEAGSSRWTLIRVGGALPLSGGWTVAGGLDYGPATIDTADTTFTKLRTELSVPFGRRWTFRAQETYVDVQPVVGHLLGAGAALALDGGLSLDVQLAQSIGGSLDDSSVSLRVDYRARAPYLMAGLVAGTSNNRLHVNQGGIASQRTGLRVVFLGLTMPLEAVDLTVAMEMAHVGTARRRSLTLAWRLPVDWSR